jgi:hypothetical protein
MIEQSSQSAQSLTAYGNPKTPDANSQDGYRLPDTSTLIHAAKLAVVEDKPILLDYWTQSLEKTVLIGVKTGGDSTEKLLVKSEDEYTSPISKIFGAGKEYIIITENSIYIVDKGIPTKRISS